MLNLTGLKAQAARGQAGAALFSLTVCHDMRMNIVQPATYSYSSILHSIPALSSASGTAKPGKPRGAGTSCREVQGGSTEVRPPSAFILLPELAAVILVANLPVQLYILQPENIFFSLSS